MDEPKKTALDVISSNLNRTIDIDPERMRIEHEYHVYTIVLDSFQAQKKELEASYAQTTLDGLKDRLDEYDAKDHTNDPIITIRYITASRLDDFQWKEQDYQSIPKGDEKNRLVDALDRLVVKYGVCNHRNCKIGDDLIPYQEEDSQGEKSTSSEIVEYYARRRWLRSLRWAIWQYNTLADQKKTK